MKEVVRPVTGRLAVPSAELGDFVDAIQRSIVMRDNDIRGQNGAKLRTIPPVPQRHARRRLLHHFLGNHRIGNTTRQWIHNYEQVVGKLLDLRQMRTLLRVPPRLGDILQRQFVNEEKLLEDGFFFLGRRLAQVNPDNVIFSDVVRGCGKLIERELTALLGGTVQNSDHAAQSSKRETHPMLYWVGCEVFDGQRLDYFLWCNQSWVGSPKNCRHEPKRNTVSDSHELQPVQPMLAAVGKRCFGAGPQFGHASAAGTGAGSRWSLNQ